MNRLLFRLKHATIQFSVHMYLYFPYPFSQRWCSQQEELKRATATDALLVGWEISISSLLYCVGCIGSTYIEG